MISYNDALLVLEEIGRLRKVRTESVPIMDAIGKILAAPVHSSEEIPSFTNSAMDGFAVASSDTFGATESDPIRLPVRGLVAAGDIHAFKEASSAQSGAVVEIMTGAPLPVGCYDAVVRVEDVVVSRSPDGKALTIEVTRPCRKGDNVRLKGTDFTRGQLVLPAGVRVAAEHVLACASLGISRLEVKTFPKIAILSTGSELVSPDEASLAPGMIRNSTGPYLLAALSQMGIQAEYLGVVRDDPRVYRQRLERAIAEGAEIIISTGAVSMGKFDFVSDVLREMGAFTHFHKAAIRPGKPVLFAELPSADRTIAFFGVPGNPVSTAVGLRFFVEPFIRAMLGLEREASVAAILARDMSKPEGLRCFFKGRARVGSNGLEVETLKGQASYVVSALLDANCWVILPEAGSASLARTQVEIVPLHNAFERGVLT